MLKICCVSSRSRFVRNQPRFQALFMLYNKNPYIIEQSIDLGACPSSRGRGESRDGGQRGNKSSDNLHVVCLFSRNMKKVTSPPPLADILGQGISYIDDRQCHVESENPTCVFTFTHFFVRLVLFLEEALNISIPFFPKLRRYPCVEFTNDFVHSS